MRHFGEILHSDNPQEIFDAYKNIFDALLFGNEISFQFKKYEADGKYESGNGGSAEKLHDIRNFLYANGLFFKDVKSVFDTVEKELSAIKGEEQEKNDIWGKMLPSLFWYMWNLQIELEWIKDKFLRFDGATFADFEPEFLLYEWHYIDCLTDLKSLRDQTVMLKEYMAVWNLIHGRKETEEDAIRIDGACRKIIKEKAKLFFERVCSFGTDKYLFDIFRNHGTTKSIIHSKTEGEVTLAFLALFIAMACGEYVSIDNGKEDWYLNIAQYIDFSKYKASLRTPKNRINKTVGLLDKKEIRDLIRQYQLTRQGKISVSAFCLLNIRLFIK